MVSVVAAEAGAARWWASVVAVDALGVDRADSVGLGSVDALGVDSVRLASVVAVDALGVDGVDSVESYPQALGLEEEC